MGCLALILQAASVEKPQMKKRKRKKKGKSRWRNMQKYRHTNNGFLVLLFFQPATIRCKDSPFLLRIHWSTWRRLSLSLFFFFPLSFLLYAVQRIMRQYFFFFSYHKRHASRFTCFTALNFGGGQRGLNYVSVFGLSGIKIQCHTERFEM